MGQAQPRGTRRHAANSFRPPKRAAPQDRSTQWQAYQALPVDEKRQLAARASPPAASAVDRTRRAVAADRGERTGGAQMKTNIVPNPAYAAPPMPVNSLGAASATRARRRPASPSGPHRRPISKPACPRLPPARGLLTRAPSCPSAVRRGRRRVRPQPRSRPEASELATQAAIVATSPTPSVLRRLACFVYEGVLLFAVLMIAGYLFSSLTQQRHALAGRAALQGFLFLVLGIYFVWFWSHGGQTLAMKTWRIRLIGQDGLAVITNTRVGALRAELAVVRTRPLASHGSATHAACRSSSAAWRSAWSPMPLWPCCTQIGSSCTTPYAARV